MQSPLKGPEPRDVAVATLLALPFVIYLLAVRWASPATAAHWARADPILTLLPAQWTLWAAPVSCFAVALIWWQGARPQSEDLKQGGKEAAIGALIALFVVGVLRLVAGPTMPAVIPPEESAGPGLLLSMTAGLQEEVVCRLAIMPACFFFLHRRWGAVRAGVVSVLLAALVFSFWHAAGETEPSSTYFVSRFLIPGCAMGIAWLISPSAIVVGHCTAHLLIPWWFQAPAGT